jgi:hypothetical protein
MTLLQKAIQENPKLLCNFHFTTLMPWRLLAGLVTELITSSEQFLHDSLSNYLQVMMASQPFNSSMSAGKATGHTHQ